VHPELKTSWKSGEKLALTLDGLSFSQELAPVTATVSEGRDVGGNLQREGSFDGFQQMPDDRAIRLALETDQGQSSLHRRDAAS
jgi:hypothetical protein